MKKKGNPNQIKGALQANKARIGIITARFNEFFTKQIVDGAVDALLRYGVTPKNIDVIHVPGAFEVPIIVKRLLKKKRYDALLTAGVILKGDTRHWTQVSDAASDGTMQASLDSDIPVIHGVVTAESKPQAIDRLGGKLGNRGRQAAETAIEMANLVKVIKKL